MTAGISEAFTGMSRAISSIIPCESISPIGTPNAISIANSPNRMPATSARVKSEHPQTRQFPRPLLQSNARTVVHDANSDDHRKQRENACAYEDKTSDLVEKRRSVYAFIVTDSIVGRLLKRWARLSTAVGSTYMVAAENHGTFPRKSVERIDLHIGCHPDHLVDTGADR